LFFFIEIGPKRNVLGKEEQGCSCSEDCELGMKSNVSNDEMMSKLEMCIRFGMCPHVLLQKCGVTQFFYQPWQHAMMCWLEMITTNVYAHMYPRE
jgi:hypothetical protein